MAAIAWSLNAEDVTASLLERKELLQAAILDTVNSLGQQLLERVQGKLSGEALHERTGVLLKSVEWQAAEYVGLVCQTSVGIDEGSPSYLYGLVQEYGGKDWYWIAPIEETFDIVGLPGRGRISPHSKQGFAPYEEGRLPHMLAWEGPEGTVFASRVYHPPDPERSYLRSSLAEMEDMIYEQLNAAVNGVLAGEAVA